MKQFSRKRFHPPRIGFSIEDYRALKRAYENLERNFKLFGKGAQRDHFELLREHNALRYHPAVQFLTFLHVIPRDLKKLVDAM